MAYQLLATITAVWVPEGAGPVSVASAQSETLGIGSVGNTFPPVQITESTIGTLTAAQEAVLVQASPILFNMLLTAFLQKQQASAVPTPPGA